MAGGDATKTNKVGGYNTIVGMVYLFNLMMGAGLLALPKAFVQVGWVLGTLGISVLTFMSYCTVTYIIEAQSIYNALQRHSSAEGKGSVQMQNSYSKNMEEDNTTIPNLENNIEENQESPKRIKTEDCCDMYLYEIATKTEFGELSAFFLNKFGYILFYVAFCVYLYGSTAVYAAASSKSIASIVCNDHEGFHSRNDTIPCSTIPQVSLKHMYYASLTLFSLLCCPFAFFTLTKTKVLQLSTMAFRCFALITMIVLAVIRIANGKGPSHTKLSDFAKLPDFFGAAVTALTCHYSVPTVITPIQNKRRVRVAVCLAFLLVLLFCVLISMTAVYAFDASQVQDVYTLTFNHPLALKYILELFPVLTLGANYPVLAIALRDNIKKLILQNSREEEYGVFVHRIVFPVVAVAPSIIISFFTYDVGMLVTYSGAYTGTMVQYIFPVFLVYQARKRAREQFGEYANRYSSFFGGMVCLILIFFWYLITLGFVTYSKVK